MLWEEILKLLCLRLFHRLISIMMRLFLLWGMLGKSKPSKIRQKSMKIPKRSLLESSKKNSLLWKKVELFQVPLEVAAAVRPWVKKWKNRWKSRNVCSSKCRKRRRSMKQILLSRRLKLRLRIVKLKLWRQCLIWWISIQTLWWLVNKSMLLKTTLRFLLERLRLNTRRIFLYQV